MLRTKLLDFTAPQDEAQLKTLEKCLADAFSSDLSQDDKAALLDVFERFPDADGLGVFWGIVHGLEHVDNYEAELVASVGRRPNLFNTLMLNRMLNAGIEIAAGESIENLFRQVLGRADLTKEVAEQVKSFLKRCEVRQ